MTQIGHFFIAMCDLVMNMFTKIINTLLFISELCLLWLTANVPPTHS